MKNKSLIVLLIVVFLTGCAEGGVINKNKVSTSQSVSDVLESQAIRSGDSEKKEIEYYPLVDDGVVSEYDKGDIDVDLTEMSGNMIYAQVNEMMFAPNDYDKQVIRMEGFFSIYTDDQQTVSSNMCIIPDATACCAQGVEFILKDGYHYPNEGEKVTVTGVFTAHNFNGFTYVTVENAEIYR